ncbi:MAG: cobalt ECF transporter T component CbiQ [Candidatus Omnitrophota bacterium]
MHHPYVDEYSGINSFIHRLEPRVKTIGFFSFIVFISLSKPGSYLAFTLYACLVAVLIGLSRIPLKFIFKRSLVVIPFVLMISAFIPFMKNGRIIARYGLGGLELVITHEGLALFFNILIKAFLSICCMVLVMNSMRFCDFLKALQKLKIPLPIITILSFMYRYIFVIEDEFMKMKQAKDSRSTGNLRWLDFKTYCIIAGALFLNSYDRAESVYLAMCSRGYRGVVNTIDNSAVRQKDIIFLVGLILLLAGIRLTG